MQTFREFCERREDPCDEEYRLLTVTYDTTSAPYLAIRTLLQLTSDEECRFPRGALAVREHTYVDDVLAGGDNLKDALEVKAQTEQLRICTGGFELSKWAGSHMIQIVIVLSGYFQSPKKWVPLEFCGPRSKIFYR